MTEQLVERSQNLRMKRVKIIFKGNIIFFEWEMDLSFKKTPDSKIYGAISLTLNNNKLIKLSCVGVFFKKL